MAEVERLIAKVEAQGAQKAAAEMQGTADAADAVARNRRGRVRIDVDDRQVKSATKSSKALDTQLVGLQGTAQRLQGLKLGGQGLTKALGIPAALSAVGPLVGGINALAGGATALVAPLTQATSLFAGIPAVVGGAGAAFGTFKLATMGVGDAIKESTKLSQGLADALALGDKGQIDKAKEKIDELTATMEGKFAPSALEFIGLMPVIRTELEETGKTLQSGLFRGATDGLMGLRQMLREITPELGGISAALGGMAGGLGRQVSSADFLTNLRPVIMGAVPMIDTLGAALGSLLDVFVTLGAKAQPVLGRIEGTVMRMTGSMENWADSFASSSFDTAYETFQDLWGIIRNLGDAFSNTLAAFRPMGDWLLGTLESLSAQWAAWTRSVEGQNSLKEWADSSKPVLVELGALLRDLGSMWADAANPESMSASIRILRTGLLPALNDILTAADASGIFETLVGALEGLAKIVGTLAGTSGVLSIMLDLFAGITNLIGDVITSTDWLGTSIGNLAAAFGLLKIINVGGIVNVGLSALLVLTDQLFGSMQPLVPVIAGFAAAWASVSLANTISELGAVVALIPSIKSFADVSTLAGEATGILGISGGKAGDGAKKAGAGAKGGTAGVAGMSAAIGGLSVGALAATAGVAALAAGVAAYSQAQAEAKNRTDEVAAVFLNLDKQNPLSGLTADLTSRFTAKEMIDDFAAAGTSIEEFANKGAGGLLRLNEETGRLESTVDTSWTRTTKGMQTDVAGLNGATQDYINSLAEQGAGFAPTIRGLNEVAGAYADGLDQTMDTLVAQGQLTREEADAIYSKAQLRDGSIDLARLSGELAEALYGEERAIAAANEQRQKANKELDTYYSFLSRIVSIKDFVKVQDDLVGKLQASEKTLRENKGAIDNNTEAGRTNRDVLRDLYDQYVGLGTAVYNSTGDVDQATGAYGLFKAELERLQGVGALTEEQVKAVSDQLLLTEGTYTAELQLSIKQDQYQKLQLLSQTLQGVDDHGAYQAAVQAYIAGDYKAVEEHMAVMKWYAENPTLGTKYTLEEIRKLTVSGAVPPNMPDGSIYYAGGKLYTVSGGKSYLSPKNIGPIFGGSAKQADGAVVAGRFADGYLPQQAKIQMPRAGLVQWAEPETHGEAFIPLAPSKRGRSLAIWQETGRRLGVMASGGLMGPETINAYRSAAKSMNSVDRTVAEWPSWFIPPTPDQRPTGGTGRSGGKGIGGSFQRIVDYINKLGIPWRNMGTWAYRNVAGTNRLSLHATGRAVDLGDPSGASDSPALLRIYRALKAAPFPLAELIYSGPGGSNPRNPITRRNHHNHVHAAVANGGIITPFANGGIVRRPTVGLVGEAGPEAVIPLRSFANGGFTADTDWGRAAEAMNNAWERTVTTLERKDPTKAMMTIYNRMLREQVKMHSDEWERMYSRIEAIQANVAAEAERRKLNKWEYEFEKADPAKQLQMASAAQKKMVAWSDDWVAMQRRIEEARAAGSGPAVYIANATFKSEADIDAMNRSASWAIRTERL